MSLRSFLSDSDDDGLPIRVPRAPTDVAAIIPQGPDAQQSKDIANTPPNPGPLWTATASDQECTIIAGANITNFWTFLVSAEKQDCDAIIVQEHGNRQGQMGVAAATAAKSGFELLAGPLDETEHAGVGMLIKKPGRGQ